MTLFQWSTPERRRLDQALPTIPNEIYLSIIELVAPPASLRVLALQQRRILFNLSRTCRFFGNICLPRLYEFIEFSRPLFCHLYTSYEYEASLGSILCTQIAKKQPLALALAQSVKGCRFRMYGDDLDTKRCITPVSHMKNIRKVEFANCDVEEEYWSMLAALPSLEDLAFSACHFPQAPVYTEPEKCLKLQVSRLKVVKCGAGYQQTIAAVDTGCLRTLAMDFYAIEKQDWLRQSAITELHLYTFEDDCFDESDPFYTPELNVALVKAPQSLKALHFMVDETAACNMAENVVESMMKDSAWKDLPSLCLLALRMVGGIPDWEGSDIGLYMIDNLPKMQRLLHDKVGPVSTLSNLKYIEYFGNVFRLVDGEWSEGVL